MQSSPGASFLRRSALILSFSLLGFLRAGLARAADTEPNASGSPPASAEPAPLAAMEDRVILIVRTRGDDELMLRLLAELRESDWRILEVRPDERFAPAPLGTVAERERAGAAVRLDARRGVVELWIRRPDGPVEETIAAPSPPNDQVLALRVTETLRARGLLVAGEKHAEVPKAEPSSPEPERAPEAPHPERPAQEKKARNPLSFELGPGFALSPGGLGPLALLEGGVRVELLERFSACAVGFFPLSHQSLAGSEGEAEVKTAFVGGIVELEWARLSFGGFRSGLGATAAITSMSGRATNGGFASSEDTVVTFAPLARTSFHVVLGPSFRIRTAVVVGATFPEVGVAFGSRPVATFGQPFVLGSLALEVSPFH
ncbi:MAG TPA: hypothetical protein VF103_16825 [Polyangiaceae bacterium]